MASVFGGDSASPRTAPPQTLGALKQQPPSRRGPQPAHRRLRVDAPRKISPARRDRPRAAIHQPADDRRLTGLRAPPEHVQLNTAKLTGRVNEPHPLRQRIHNMSSATPTRPAPARRTWQSRSGSAPASPATASRSHRHRMDRPPRRRPAPRPPRHRARQAATHPAARRRRSGIHPLRSAGRQPHVHARLAPLRARLADRHLQQALQRLGARPSATRSPPPP